jgi:hypothetical protein
MTTTGLGLLMNGAFPHCDPNAYLSAQSTHRLEQLHKHKKP